MSSQLATVEPQNLAVQQQSITPMMLLSQAVDKGADMETVERLSKLAERMMEREAEVVFNQSMHAAQMEMRRIGADATNPQTRSKYATYAKLDSALRPIYSKHGFSVSFNTADCPVEGCIRVIAYVSHKDGHTRTYQIDMPADGKGAKGNDVMTKTHATGAATAYGQRYLLKMIFNVAVGETDDDGNGGGSMDTNGAADFIESIRTADNLEDLKKRFFAAREAAQKAKDKDAENAFIDEKDKRYRHLQGRGQ